MSQDTNAFTRAREAAYSLVRQALDFQVQAAVALTYYISILKPKTEDRRRAKLQRRHSAERTKLLCQYLKNPFSGLGPPAPRPSDLTINQEMTDDGSVVFLSMVERNIWTNLPNQSPFFTPLLSPSLPATTYHAYLEIQTRHSGPTWHFFHIKDSSKSQTFYTMTICGIFDNAVNSFIDCNLLRASSCDNVCAQVEFNIPDNRRTTGCKTKIFSPAGTRIVPTTDLAKSWTPRRFTYGNRRFAWHTAEPTLNRNNRSTGVPSGFLRMEELYEVTQEWEEPNGLPGQKGDQKFERPLAWGERTSLDSNTYTVNLAGGLDQLFREFILASMLAPIMLDLSFKNVTMPKAEIYRSD